MWNYRLVILMTFSICIGISLSAPSQTVLAQEIPTNASSNASGIMQNTTGVIDDAFDALKDSFGTLFGGN
ncbi:MAG TPA: hypothetical protein VJS91_08130 [Nitrososphaeraceae archaeon]|nr:hypothetical protein [Nitrososphaeraceae archaeon]